MAVIHGTWHGHDHATAVGVCWEFCVSVWCWTSSSPRLGRGREMGALWSSYMQLALVLCRCLVLHIARGWMWVWYCGWPLPQTPQSVGSVWPGCPVLGRFMHSTHHPYLCVPTTVQNLLWSIQGCSNSLPSWIACCSTHTPLMKQCWWRWVCLQQVCALMGHQLRLPALTVLEDPQQ